MTPVIEMRNIVKMYSNGVVANKGINFSVERGEIHALVGENGAGKSTLMKILYGLEQPTEGELLLDGKTVEFKSPQEAIANGIGMVHQNFMLVPSFTVAENVVLGAEPLGKGGMLDTKQALQVTADLSKQYGLRVDADAVLDSINVGMRQRVEILKMLYRGAQILILDEPTAVLTPQETQELFVAVRALVDQGKTVVFITHKLREVKEISDRVTVMRDGKLIGTQNTADTTTEDMARMMVGREVFLNVNKAPQNRGDKVMEVQNLSYVSEVGRVMLRNVSFNVYAGEVLGIAGVEGNGQTELVEVLTGLRPAASGDAMVHGKVVTSKTPREVRMAGVAHIPEDRLTNGLALDASIEENLIVDRYFDPPFRKGLMIDRKMVLKQGQDLIEEFNIRTPNGQLPVTSLSGGNMQKVIVAREFSSNPKVLIASQPTRGIDVGATEFIRDQLVQKRTDGAAVLLISADLLEVMSLSDRIIAVYEGEITGVFPDAASVSEEELGLYMLGVKRQSFEEMEAYL
ncbi:MAG: ABC transporter ATP-binding protein [Anaerolineaceae bacterium]|nr:ABC transporter ATP-binding protein [Anaerolineaceae bacterium]